MAMNANIVVSLDTRKAKMDGTFPLIMRLGVYRHTIPIPLGYSIKLEDWDEKERKVKSSYKGTETVVRLNNLLQKKKTNALDILMKLEEKGELKRLSLAEVKELIVGKSTSKSFFKYADDLISSLKEAKRFGTATSYGDVIKVLRAFVGTKELSFDAITFDFLTRFETHHLAKDGNGLNGLAVYMRTIRAIYNRGIKSGDASKENYPFDGYKIKTVPTKKRALGIELLNKIICMQLEPNDILFDARNYFVASYMMYGMNFKDMAFLRKSDVINGRINYRRNKTSKLYDIKLFPALGNILAHYVEANADSDFVFPILMTEELEAQTRSVKWARKRYNAKLKQIAKLCGIEENLTSYVSRHSFATQAMMMTVPITAISAMLGHSSIKTTETYLKSLPSNVLDEYNEQIMAAKSPKI